MVLGVEVAVMGWDLSLRAQSKRALVINSIWLREDGEEESDESLNRDRKSEYKPWGIQNKLEIGKTIDPGLGINLKGNLSSASQWVKNILANQAQSAMEHDLEKRVIIG
ncbi:hypothetical protein PVK06_001088 [Gossypium arboreum]|uniref:Uncharacterized protein n=1 Tax=Gossypium arboreum TaxID=29729 RepID=A0ABR0R152_GOSAR|nr:hypothetical protein PVK06_001088 [Gossypium arboreum]